ncbi:MAG: hemerythrin domain-containing protein [Flavobacteriales bacterium]|nr:hemerythrin domain-containing protein [Flavobacteriales bacterium]
MHNAIRSLYDEHEMIVEAIEVAKEAGTLIGKDDERYVRTMKDLIDFFRTYADQYHHHKEEEVLFPLMLESNEMLGDGVLKEMLENHADFREMLDGISKDLEAGRLPQVRDGLARYSEALLDHIAVENDEVFHMAMTLLDDNTLDRVGFQFEDHDRETGAERKEELARMVRELRKELAV